MSKAAFLKALALVRSGDLTLACEQLRSVDPTFIRKRLNHYKSQPDQREAALQLEAALGASLAPRLKIAPMPDPLAFKAPLPPDTVETAPTKQVTFDDPLPFLAWASANWDRVPVLRFNDLVYTDIWLLVALACLLLPERGRRPPVDLKGNTSAVRFAHAVGLDAITGGYKLTYSEPWKTVSLTRVRTRAEIEPTADHMATLIISEEENDDVRLMVKYVLVELLRNVIQHSGDPLGAVVAAQRMGGAQRRSSPMIQLAVADAGIGIPRHLQRSHPHLVDYRQALERALLPHISGTFVEGLTGSFENAGMGLYMISELARQTCGRLLLATTGAALVLPSAESGTVVSPRFLDPVGVGFPGTLVAFEIPTDATQDYDTVMRAILKKAEERTPKRASSRWLNFAPGPEGAHRIGVFDAREDTLAAAALNLQEIRPRVMNKTPIEIDFTGLELCTQSWLHALLFEPVRLAWALHVPIYVVGERPAVREGLRFLESYALGG
jgi:hypothetical protein